MQVFVYDVYGFRLCREKIKLKSFICKKQHLRISLKIELSERNVN